MRLSLTILIFSLLFSTSARSIFPLKILVLKVDESGFVSDGFSTISSENLAGYVRERLFMNFKGTGKMYDKIEVIMSSDKIPKDVRDILVKEVAAGQKAALTEYCLFKYSKVYDNLTDKQKEKVQKSFPVLFQSEFVVIATIAKNSE